MWLVLGGVFILVVRVVGVIFLSRVDVSACHDGIGPHSSGRSRSGVSGWWVSRLISWFQYFSFDASRVQCLRVRIDRCALVGYL